MELGLTKERNWHAEELWRKVTVLRSKEKIMRSEQRAAESASAAVSERKKRTHQAEVTHLNFSAHCFAKDCNPF